VTIWAGLSGSITAARTLLQRMQGRWAKRSKGSRSCLPIASSVLAHQAAARAPLARTHQWNALIEFVSSSDDPATLRDAAETALAKRWRRV
jgi:hypothetical protein